MFGTSGIRGEVGTDVTADVAFDVGRALACEGYDAVLVGRDPRPSGTVLADAVSAGLRDCGSDVVRAGVLATPTLARGVSSVGADAGVMVTASHNPAGDNGLKLWSSLGAAFDRARQNAVERRIRDEAFTASEATELGSETTVETLVNSHVGALVDAAEVDEDLTVAVDPGNGPGRLTAEALRRLGCSVTTINAELDGRFPARPSEPTADNCAELRDLVAATDADVGVAHDGDADRMMAVTGAGEFVSGDVLLALFAKHAVESGSAVAAPLNTSLAVDRTVGEVDASVKRTRVGDVHVAERAQEPDVEFGGEPSGTWIWPDQTFCPDGPLAACRLAELVSDAGPLEQLVASVETYPTKRSSVEVTDKEAKMEQVRAGIREDETEEVDTRDGIRVETDDGWFLVRASGTESLVRVTAEATEEQRASALHRRALELVEQGRRTARPTPT